MDDDGTILSDFSYYTFGLRWDYNDSPNYEWNRVGALEQDGIQNHIDLMAYRSCYRTTGRFSGIDPASQQRSSFSGYNMVQNNPVNRIDPSGAIDLSALGVDDWYEDSSGNIIYDASIKSQSDLNDAGIQGTYLGEVFIDFKGSTPISEVYNFRVIRLNQRKACVA